MLYCSIITILLVGFVLSDACGGCQDDSSCCTLREIQRCVPKSLFHCSIEAPYAACGINQCPIPGNHTLCSLGTHRYFHCAGIQCCTKRENIQGSFIFPAEHILPVTDHYLSVRVGYVVFISISILALLLTQKWNYVRTKNLNLQVADVLSHYLLLRYLLSPQPYDSCYIRHLIGGVAVYHLPWNSKILQVYFKNQAMQLEKQKKTLIFAKQIDLGSVEPIRKGENELAFLRSGTISVLMVVGSLVIGITEIYALTDISPFESATCIFPNNTIGVVDTTISVGNILALAFVTVVYNAALDAYSAKWEMYIYLIVRIANSLIGQLIYFGMHMGIFKAVAIITGGETLPLPFNLYLFIVWSTSAVDIIVGVWIPIAFELIASFQNKIYSSLQRETLARDDLFISQLANHAVREYSVDAVLCWKMLLKLHENRSTPFAAYFEELFLNRKLQFSHVDIRWCLEEMRNISDILDENKISFAEERIRTRYLDPMAKRMFLNAPFGTVTSRKLCPTDNQL